MVATPKLRQHDKEQDGLYKYYAGYSTKFVEDVLALSDIKRDGLILDPWNGSGTTTAVCANLGHSAIGYDLNPAMVIVARARLLDGSVSESLTSLCEDIIEKSQDLARALPHSSDPLDEWLYPQSARLFRAIDVAIRKLLVDADNYHQFYVPEALNRVSSLAAFFYVAAFRALRKTLQAFASSNPTWIKSPTSQQRARPSADTILTLFRNEVKELKCMLQSKAPRSADTVQQTRIEIGNSSVLPLRNEVVDVILTSPPYCTRIDYVVATKPELAFIGLGQDARISELRNGMIGTPTMRQTSLKPDKAWGTSCNAFVRQVRKHNSKASQTYYLKYFVQYFDSMFNSLKELHRVAKHNAAAWLVVQDSYYKDVHNDLPLIIEEMAQEIGWKKEKRIDFPLRHTLAGTNVGARKYRDDFMANEAVLVIEKS